MTTILLLLDAFRCSYLTEETTPFLYKCAKEGEYYVGVEQSLGFCERSEILTGLSGDETGFFTAIGFNPPSSPFSKVPWLRFLNVFERAVLFFLNFLPSNLIARVHKKLRYFVSCYFKKFGIMMPAYFIPYSWLSYFTLTEDRIDHRNPNAFQFPTIITLLEKAGRTYFYDTFTALNFQSPFRLDGERLDAVVNDIKESSKDLYLVYIDALDVYGHCYGPDSLEFREVLQQLDRDLKQFTELLESVAPGNRYLFLGDHGMVTVTNRIDAEKEISRLLHSVGLRKGYDVIYFLDSTMIRFWALTDKARSLLTNTITSSEIFNENGSWMDKQTAKSNHVSWPDRRYGDHLWIANPGVLVFPDFFHRYSPCKGMHGYDPKLPESRGMCIHWGEGIYPSVHPVIPLTKIFNLLKINMNL